MGFRLFLTERPSPERTGLRAENANGDAGGCEIKARGPFCPQPRNGRWQNEGPKRKPGIKLSLRLNRYRCVARKTLTSLGTEVRRRDNGKAQNRRRCAVAYGVDREDGFLSMSPRSGCSRGKWGSDAQVRLVETAEDRVRLEEARAVEGERVPRHLTSGPGSLGLQQEQASDVRGRKERASCINPQPEHPRKPACPLTLQTSDFNFLLTAIGPT